VNSLLAAGLYATMSYGLAVIYGVMRIINLAHAGILMLGAYVTFTLHSRFGLDPFLSLAVVVPVFFGFGVLLYQTMVRRLPRSQAGPRSSRFCCSSASGSSSRTWPTPSGEATRSRS
jgi:branched-chain amino acid transport system permease protein